MLPLILLALGLGVALTAYEFSPRAHARIDDYARALREAHAAHFAADAHLSNANTAASVAAQHAQASIDARRPVQESSAPAPVPPSIPAPLPPSAPASPVPPAPPAPVPSPAPSPIPSPADLPSPAADAHANAAQVATGAGLDHAAAATEANQEAARKTAEAAQRAKTEADRAAAAQSAAKVIEREKKIADALAKLGVGQCGVRSYSRATPQVTGALLARLHSEGMTVTGDNPWDIETHKYDVKLRAVWDPKTQTLRLIVTSGQGGYLGLVTCDEIWGRIDPIMKGVIGT